MIHIESFDIENWSVNNTILYSGYTLFASIIVESKNLIFKTAIINDKIKGKK